MYDKKYADELEGYGPWHDWDPIGKPSGIRPPDLEHDTLVVALRRDGEALVYGHAGVWNWSDKDVPSSNQIVAYRIKGEPMPVPPLNLYFITGRASPASKIARYNFVLAETAEEAFVIGPDWVKSTQPTYRIRLIGAADALGWEGEKGLVSWLSIPTLMEKG